MAWQDSSARDEDMMGVHGDVLFADPLGIRKDKGKAAREEPRRPQSGALREPRISAARMPRDLDNSLDDLDMNLPEHRQAERQEEPLVEDPGPVRAWFGYIFGGGTQCCGNRPKDAELAKKASITGRPPSKQFPEARSLDPPSRGAAGSNDSGVGRRRNGGDDSTEDQSTRDHNRGAPAPRERDDPFATGKRSDVGGRKGGLDELHKFANSENDSLRDSKGDLLPPFDDRLKKQEGDSLRNQQEKRQPPEPRPVGSMESVGDATSLAREKPPEGHLPRKWQWPTWTLNTKEAAIEVYVTDEDSGESRWCEAEPQFRVVDKEGHDAYLCAEYNWDGEFYVQDFGPHHVRKRGQDMTVFQLFALDPSVVNSGDFMKDTMNKSVGRKNLDDTDPFMTTRPQAGRSGRADSGGGIGAYLDD